MHEVQRCNSRSNQAGIEGDCFEIGRKSDRSDGLHKASIRPAGDIYPDLPPYSIDLEHWAPFISMQKGKVYKVAL
jgi:hypothetical protein